METVLAWAILEKTLLCLSACLTTTWADDGHGKGYAGLSRREGV
jgi:CHAT domain-containing protein